MRCVVPLLALLVACPQPEPEPEPEPPIPTRWEVEAPWELVDPHPCPVQIGEDDLLGELLAELDLDRSIGIPFDVYENYGGHIESDPTRLDFFHLLQEDFDRVPCHAGNMATRSDVAFASDHPVASLLADAATQLDLEIDVGGTFEELEGDDPLLAALDLAHDDDDWDDRDEVAEAAAGLPAELRRVAARLLQGAVEAAELRDEALAEMGEEEYHDLYYRDGANNLLISQGNGVNPDWEGASGLFVGSDEGSGVLYQGAIRLGQAIDEADVAAAAGLGGDFHFRAETPLGAVVLRGTGDDEYDAELDPEVDGELLLLVDTGGDDTYRIPAGANMSADNPVALHFDLGGDDHYGYTEVPSPYDADGLLPSDVSGRYAGDAYWGTYSLSHRGRQGAGLLGYGMLFDLGGGADVYRSLRKSQGFACFGVGLLWDDGGDDDYELENGGQGGAIVGIGALVDAGGDDVYRAYAHAQAFGFVSSFGLLYDADGHDSYELVVDQHVLFHSPQQPGSANGSLGQGTAFGWRRDATGTHLGGGIALMRDFAGNDRYDASVFAQGVAYWMGLGVLADRAGDDRYNGLFYVQGATAHFAVAAFLEGGGNDTYNAERPAVSSSIGLAHDFSVTFFVEDGGDDRYFGPDRSIGAAKCHGLGVLVENGGDDRYETSHDRSIGWATDYDWAEGSCGNSTTTPSYGFFVDAGGTDEYIKPDATGYGNDTLWLPDDPEDETALEYMGGIDAATGETWAWAYGEVSGG